MEQETGGSSCVCLMDAHVGVGKLVTSEEEGRLSWADRVWGTPWAPHERRRREVGRASTEGG